MIITTFFLIILNDIKIIYLFFLRERLLKINYEAYEANLNQISQAAILATWEKRNNDNIELKFSEIINLLKKDSYEHVKMNLKFINIKLYLF